MTARRAGPVAALLALLLGGCTNAMRHGSLFVADIRQDEPAAEPEPEPVRKPTRFDAPEPVRKPTRFDAAPTPTPSATTPDADAAPVSITYRYYPAVYVYYDAGRKLYFFPENKKWKTSPKIPAKFKLKGRKFVSITMESEKPFTQNKAHRLKYPAPKPKPKPKPAAPAPASATTAESTPAPAPAAPAAGAEASPSPTPTTP